MNETILDIDRLSAFYGNTQVLFDVSLAVRSGGVTALLGANGAGKTSLLRSISGRVRRCGQLLFQGEEMGGLEPDAVARRGIAHVPCDRGTFLELSVEENLWLGAFRQRRGAQIRRDLEKMYDRFPRLRERSKQTAGMLSGGEQQMLAIARALMSRPALMILDEPSFGLAPLIVREVYALLAEINRDDRISLLIVEQNAHLALAAADHAYLLERGRLVAAGPSAQMRDDATLKRSYLGA